jgi:hypothetical protein
MIGASARRDGRIARIIATFRRGQGVKAARRHGTRKHLVIAATKSHRHRQAMPRFR